MITFCGIPSLTSLALGLTRKDLEAYDVINKYECLENLKTENFFTFHLFFVFIYFHFVYCFHSFLLFDVTFGFIAGVWIASLVSKVSHDERFIKNTSTLFITCVVIFAYFGIATNTLEVVGKRVTLSLPWFFSIWIVADITLRLYIMRKLYPKERKRLQENHHWTSTKLKKKANCEIKKSKSRAL